MLRGCAGDELGLRCKLGCGDKQWKVAPESRPLNPQYTPTEASAERGERGSGMPAGLPYRMSKRMHSKGAGRRCLPAFRIGCFCPRARSESPVREVRWPNTLGGRAHTFCKHLLAAAVEAKGAGRGDGQATLFFAPLCGRVVVGGRCSFRMGLRRSSAPVVFEWG